MDLRLIQSACAEEIRYSYVQRKAQPELRGEAGACPNSP